MNWKDEGYLLSKNNFNENSIIIEAITLDHGKYSGIVYGGSSRKLKKDLQIGNKLLLNLKSKNDNKSSAAKVTNYQDVIKSNKKSNITSENINQIMLAQIPGVSSTIAESIILEFGTVKKLVDRLEKDNQCLDNFKISAKNQTRKLSKNVIANIKELLLEKDKINIE